MADTMHALRLHARGGPEQMRYEDAPLPYVGIGDVLLRVQGASFTPTELTWPSTWVDRLGRDRLPVIPGHEVSGVVAGLGYGTTGARVGDEVYGLIDWYRDGAAADYTALPVRNLAPKPASLDHVRAAMVPLAGLTAWQGLFDHAGLEEDQRVLILGAAGGVGVFAVQLAAAAGAVVVGSGRAWSKELVLDLGAGEYVDLEHQRLADLDGVDVVFDLIGGQVLEKTWPVVKRGGMVVSAVEDSLEAAAGERGLRGVFFVVEPSPEGLGHLARRIDDGRLRPVAGDVLPLERGREAFETKRRGGVPGKSGLSVGEAKAKAA